MKKVSAKLFFAVLCKGLGQAVRWLLELFGYQGEDRFAKMVWKLFALSATVIMAIIAFDMVWDLGYSLYRYYEKQNDICNLSDCYHSEYISRDIYYHNTHDNEGFIYNINTDEKLVEHVLWIAEPLGGDSLVCFNNGKKRGYFSKNTGKVVIEPKYDHAWVFSDGLASVDDGGYIKFIDATGKVVIDRNMPYIPNMGGYVFHGGYCVVDTDDGKQCGLMDKTGKMTLPMEYSYIYPTDDFLLWYVRKGEEMAVLDKELKPVIPLMECSIYIGEGTIDVTMPDHSIRKYDMHGHLIDDFYLAGVKTLEYEKDEILYRTRTHDDEGYEYAMPVSEAYHPKANAHMRAYIAGMGFQGLMTKEGHIVTMPLYENIEAIDYDLYLCEVSNGHTVIVNGKGEIIK